VILVTALPNTHRQNRQLQRDHGVVVLPSARFAAVRTPSLAKHRRRRRHHYHEMLHLVYQRLNRLLGRECDRKETDRKIDSIAAQELLKRSAHDLLGRISSQNSGTVLRTFEEGDPSFEVHRLALVDDTMCLKSQIALDAHHGSAVLQLPQRSQLANVIEHQRVLSKGVFRAEGLQAQHLRAKSVLGAACRTTQISSTCSVVLL